MFKKLSGKIINLAAPAAFRGYFGVTDYASAKGGIVAFTKMLLMNLSLTISRLMLLSLLLKLE